MSWLGAGAHISAHKAKQEMVVPFCQDVPGEVQFCCAFLLRTAVVLLSLHVVCPHLLEDKFGVKIMSNQDIKSRIRPLD